MIPTRREVIRIITHQSFPIAQKVFSNLKHQEMPDITSTSVSEATSTSSAAPPSTISKESALSFLASVREGVSPPEYNAFLDVMKAFKQGHISRSTVIVLCRALFHNSADLTRGFMVFVGAQNEDEQTKEEVVPAVVPLAVCRTGAGGMRNATPQLARRAEPKPDFDRAISFVTTVKARFKSAPRTYKDFLKVLDEYKKKKDRDSDGALKVVISRVASLFADHADLREGFVHFLPDSAQARVRRDLGLQESRVESAESPASDKTASESTADESWDTAETDETPTRGYEAAETERETETTAASEPT